jgi:hypothetical protein
LAGTDVGDPCQIKSVQAGQMPGPRSVCRIHSGRCRDVASGQGVYPPGQAVKAGRLLTNTQEELQRKIAAGLVERLKQA